MASSFPRLRRHSLDAFLPLLTQRPGIVVNSLWFNAFWLSAVLGGNSMLAVPAALLVVHLWWIRMDLAEVIFILCVVLLGAAIDSVLVVYGVFEFSTTPLIPAWLILLWAGFAATVRHSLRVFDRHWAIAALFGGFGGATSYFAGEKLGVVGFGHSLQATLLTLVCIWMLLLPLLYRLSDLLTALVVAMSEKPS
ncbi:Uncharacterised protein [BD1-7 clade bacterium]|uniref:DUF2878 domain-containing protein n=1 Tax=BD1-7 clade bacterium TaxID=2029982 RepID=A0A5S9QXW7_9GAMM|nr:Uncharacterised protein [BD1-7 clade bacterium]